MEDVAGGGGKGGWLGCEADCLDGGECGDADGVLGGGGSGDAPGSGGGPVLDEGGGMAWRQTRVLGFLGSPPQIQLLSYLKASPLSINYNH